MRIRCHQFLSKWCAYSETSIRSAHLHSSPPLLRISFYAPRPNTPPSPRVPAAYQEVTIRPGPRLNVVVGPNGTGKSSIVCAIAIGLGAHTSLLGRSENLGEFVMNGCDKGFVEIELYTDGAGANTVIRRSMEADKTSSKWLIDSKPATLKKVHEIVERTGAQLSNLCTFLPQEKVGEFSGFDSKQLLLETSKAVGGEDQYANHMKLQEMELELNDQSRQVESKKKKISELTDQNAALERDKKQMEEREEHVAKVDLCKKKLLWIDFEDLQHEAKEAKEKQKEAEAELAKAGGVLQPLKDKIFAAQTIVTREEKRSTNAKKEMEAIKKSIKGSESKVETYSEKIDEYYQDINNISSRVKEQEAKVRKAQQTLEAKQQALADFNLPAIKAEAERLRKAKEDLAIEMQPAIDELKKHQACHDQLKDDIASFESRLAEVGNAENKMRQNYANLGQLQRNAVKAKVWLEGPGRGQFLRPVHGPIAMEVKLRDDRDRNLVGIVEDALGGRLCNAFVAECDEDYRKLQKSPVASGIDIYNCEGGKLTVYNKRSEAVMKDLKSTGLMHRIDDLIDCPDAVRHTLRAHRNVDSTFIGNDRLSAAFEANQKQVEGKLLSVGGAVTFYAPGSKGGKQFAKYAIKKSKYHQNDTLVTSNSVKETRLLQVCVSAGGSSEEEDELQGKLAELNEQNSQVIKEGQAADKVCEGFRKKMKKVKEQLSKKQLEMNGEKKLKQDINSAQKKLKTIQKDGDIDVDKEKSALLKKLKSSIKGKIDAIAQVQDDTARFLDVNVACGAAVASYEMAKDLLKQRETALQEEEQQLEDKKALIQELKATFKEKKAKLKEVQAEAKQEANLFTGVVLPDGQKEYNELGKKLNEMPKVRSEVVVMLEEAQAQVDAIHHNPAVIEQYNRRKEHIAKLEAEVKDILAGGSAASDAFEVLRKQWEGQVYNMAKKLHDLFAEYMRALGNIGIVEVEKGDTFDGWGLRLLVSFRKGSAPVPLQKAVQSGGERSVSTIMFLMALQDMVRSPFRVVDEINQGMDEKNERVVFGRIVANSTGPARPQYFLITPKLLQGLTSMENEDVTVLFVFNGPYVTGMGAQGERWNLLNFFAKAEANKDIVDKRRRLSEAVAQPASK